jgi:signal transduction histidine kinase
MGGWWRLLPSRKRELRARVDGLASRAIAIFDPAERISFLQSEISITLGLARAEILLQPEGSDKFAARSTEIRNVLTVVSGALDGLDVPVLSERTARSAGLSARLRQLGASCAVLLRHEGRTLGLMLLDAGAGRRMDPQLESLLLPLAAQIGLVLDNSNKLKARLELQDRLVRQATVKELLEMLGRVAHEIKNPLGAMKVIVQVMQEDGALLGRYEKDLRLVSGEIDRLSVVVKRVLDYLRPAQDENRPVQLREVVASTVDILKHDFEREESAVECEIPEDLPEVVGTPELYKGVLFNLLQNAFQAGGRGTKVWIRAWPSVWEDGSQRYVMLVVEDNGPGIPAELQSGVFRPFFSTRVKGTGLGLSIVQRSIESVGGHIQLESPARDDRGARFLMYLPLAVSDTALMGQA